MNTTPRFWELQFEMAVMSHLEDDCGLRVRAASDPLNRRRVGYATLQFDYAYPGGTDSAALVRILVPEAPECSQSLSLELRQLRESVDLAELCQGLAEGLQSRFCEQLSLPRSDSGRREDD